jgi:hypothetical protein
MFARNVNIQYGENACQIDKIPGAQPFGRVIETVP